jgi:hypothetical protein
MAVAMYTGKAIGQYRVQDTINILAGIGKEEDMDGCGFLAVGINHSIFYR